MYNMAEAKACTLRKENFVYQSVPFLWIQLLDSFERKDIESQRHLNLIIQTWRLSFPVFVSSPKIPCLRMRRPGFCCTQETLNKLPRPTPRACALSLLNKWFSNVLFPLSSKWTQFCDLSYQNFLFHRGGRCSAPTWLSCIADPQWQQNPCSEWVTTFIRL